MVVVVVVYVQEGPPRGLLEHTPPPLRQYSPTDTPQYQLEAANHHLTISETPSLNQ
eukprot:gene26302-biopygen15711